MPPRRIVFMGTPDFAVPSLEALHRAGHDVVLAISQPDKPRGRGRTLQPTPVRERAGLLRIATHAMDRTTYADGVSTIREARPDAVIVVAFGVILRRDLLDLPPFGCVNVHASLLPRHRGTSPIQAAILAGDHVTGCTTMRIDEGVDTGDILLQEEISLGPKETAGSLSDRLAALGADLLVRTMEGVFAGTLHGRPQDDASATMTRRIKKEHGQVDWSRSAGDVDRRIRAMTPWPSAYTFLRDRRIVLLDVDPSTGQPGVPHGTIISTDPLAVACGTGTLVIHSLRPEGGRSMSAAAFRAGTPLAAGDRFESGPAR